MSNGPKEPKSPNPKSSESGQSPGRASQPAAPSTTLRIQDLPSQLQSAILGIPRPGPAFPQPVQLVLPGIIQQAQHWQGPYPPPEAVERYEKVLPGTFNRLIAMAEQLQAAQIDQSRLALEYSRDESRRGHWLGFVATGLAMLAAIMCVWLDQPWVAGALVSVPVMAVAKALVEATKTSQPTSIVATAPTPSVPPEREKDGEKAET